MLCFGALLVIVGGSSAATTTAVETGASARRHLARQHAATEFRRALAAPTPAPNFTVTTLAGTYISLQGVAIDSARGAALVTANHAMRMVNLTGGEVITLAGLMGSQGSADGAAGAARFNYPGGVAIDGKRGQALIADMYNSAIRAVDLATSVVTTLAGGTYGSTDGAGEAAKFAFPEDAAIDSERSAALVADTGNHAVRMIDIASGEVTTLAGRIASSGALDGTGKVARFNRPRAVAISGWATPLGCPAQGCQGCWLFNFKLVRCNLQASGATKKVCEQNGALWCFTAGKVLLVADSDNHAVRMVNLANSVVTTLAGRMGSSGTADGAAGDARFSEPTGIAVDSGRGKVLIADRKNHAIRMIDLATDIVTTLAGGFGGADGVGRAALFKFPRAVAIDSTRGIALVADELNLAIRQITLYPVCGANRYAAWGALACLTCARGSFTSGGTSTTRNSCEVCPAGFSSCDGTDMLLPCGADYKYSATGAETCSVCAPGSFTGGGTNTTRTFCSVCPAGYSCDGRSAKVPCGVDGRYSAAGALACSTCSPGSYTDGGTGSTRTSCTTCPAGFECPGGSAKDQCPCGQFSSAGAATCTVSCPDGRYGVTSDGAATCAVCPPGSRCYDGYKFACSAGSFQDEAGKQNCKLCDTAHFGSMRNQTLSTCSGLCPVDFFCPSGTKDPIACPTGTYCGAGFAVPAVRLPCLPGTFEANASDPSPARCQPCSPGSFSSATNAAACEPCPSSTFQPAAGKGFCLPHAVCAKGERMVSLPSAIADRTCTPCAAGTISATTNAEKCEACPDGTFQTEAAQASCTRHSSCVKGERVVSPPSATADRGCAPCEAGRFSTASSPQTCDECPLGKHQGLYGQTSCNACAAGSRGKAGAALPRMSAALPRMSAASHCEACLAASFSGAAGARACSACGGCDKAGEARTGCGGASAGVCVACGVGTFKADAGAGSCEPCAGGSFQNSTGQAQCVGCSSIACPNGAHRKGCGGASMGYCGTCNPGTFIDGSACAACVAGSFSDAENAAECAPCPAGTYQPVAGKGYCLPHTKCTKGERVASAPSATADLACEACATMHFSNSANAASCERCPDGKFQDVEGQPFCETCSEGSVCRADAETGIVERQQCPAGFRCSSDMVEPQRCVNRVSVPATGKCASCEDKEFANTITNECAKCPRREASTNIAALSALALGVECIGGDIKIEDFFVEGTSVNVSVPLGPGIRLLKCRGTGVCTSPVNKTDFSVHTECIWPASGGLCGACVEGYVKGLPGTPCVKCPSDGGVAPVLVLLGALLVFCALYRQCIKTMLKHARRGQKSKYLTFTLLKIAMAFLFKTSLLSRFQLDWGGLMAFLFQMNSVAGSGDPTNLASAACFGLDLHAKTKLVFAAPFIVMLLPLPFLLKARIKRQGTMFGVPQRHAYWASVLVGWWLLHPAVLAHCVVTLLTLAVGGKEYALADLSIEAVDPAYATTRNLAVALLCTFVPALPLYIFSMIYICRAELRNGTFGGDQLRSGTIGGLPQGTRIRLFYFFGGYSRARYYWEGVVFTVRTAMVLLSALSATFVEHGMLQQLLFVTMWVTLIHFVLVFGCSPYSRSAENKVNTLTQGALLALILCALGLSLDEAGQGVRAFKRTLLTSCAVLLIGTMGVLVSAFAEQFMHMRADKKALAASQAFDQGTPRDGKGDSHADADQVSVVAKPMRDQGEQAAEPSADPGGSSALSFSVFPSDGATDGGRLAMQINPMQQARGRAETADELKARAQRIYAAAPGAAAAPEGAVAPSPGNQANTPSLLKQLAVPIHAGRRQEVAGGSNHTHL